MFKYDFSKRSIAMGEVDSFAQRWSDVLSSDDCYVNEIDASLNSSLINHYSHIVRSKKHYLKPPYEHVYLTPRELQTVLQLMQHKTMKQAAATLELSHRTIEFYLKNVKKKLNCYRKNIVIQILHDVLEYP